MDMPMQILPVPSSIISQENDAVAENFLKHANNTFNTRARPGWGLTPNPRARGSGRVYFEAKTEG